MNRRKQILALAAACTIAGAKAQAATEYSISTSGATALGAFTRMNGNANSPTNSTLNRGPLAVGVSTLEIGATTYSLQPGISYVGIANLNTPVSGEPTVADDRLNYYYRESGSIQGVLDLVDSNGLRASAPGTFIRPGDPAANLFLWQNGSRFNSVSSGYSAGTTPNTIAGTPDTQRVNGRNYNAGVAEVTPNGQPLVRIAWSDVRFEQAFATSGPAAVGSTPTTAGYGLGRGNIGSTNFQQLRNASSIVGGINPSTTQLRNESLAVVPFNLVANPGTGLAEVSKDQARWLQATGRLSNGANFNSVTREIGSGTRNQGDLNLGLDPSWGGGERDRRATASYSTTNINGNVITVNIGDEADPTRSLAGSTVQDVNENRVGPSARFSDKISGSSGVRATVVASRLGIGILSAGDSRDGSNGTALASAPNTGAPMRALRVDWDNEGVKTGKQATAANVVAGDYEMWSSAQAVTVAPYANPIANDTGANAYRPINGDTNDQSGSPTSAAEPGIHRKFLDNITQSVSTYNAGTTSSITPADFIIQSAFVPPQLMAVTKTYDGDAYGSRTRSPSEEALYQAAVANGSGVLNQQTNWADPSTFNGGLGVNAVTYKIFASTNNASNATANRTIVVNSRTNLAGDFNNDQVRDLADVPDLALAYANATSYLATAQGSGVTSTSSGTNAAPGDGLIVLSDFNSNGNVTVDANNATFATVAVERADVKYFLYGATIDTSSYGTAQNRRENGVRFGQLKKNLAIDTFNSTLDGFVGSVINPGTGLNYTQGEVDALKFNKFDVDGNTVLNREDARYVDRNVGKNYTTLSDVLSTYDDLVSAELNDNNVITHVVTSPDSDFKLLRVALGGSLLDGDANIDGGVDTVDFNLLASNFGSSVTRWSDADFDFNGSIDTVDFNLLAAEFGNVAPGDGLGALVPEPSTLGLICLAGVSVLRRRRI